MDVRRRISFNMNTGSGEPTEPSTGTYTIDLNSQWEKTTSVSNPDSTLYDGVYRSSSNYNVGSSASIMYIDISGYSEFTLYIRSYAEGNFDYVMVSELDKTITRNSSYSDTTLVKAHTRGNQQSGTMISDYTEVKFTNIDGGSHRITILYRKDGSVDDGADRGYLLIKGGVSGGTGGDDVTGPINTDNYLTILALEDGLTASLSNNACQYCVDGDGNWIDLPTGTVTQAINQGQTLSFKGNLTPKYPTGIGTFTISKKCNLEGNCMSLLFRDDAANNYSLSSKTYAFYKLFYNCTTIIEVSETFLPATTLADSCYRYMFYGCSSLTTAPELPVTTLVTTCYYYMFGGCSNLNYIKMLATNISASGCLNNWVYNVSSTGTFVKNPAMTSLPTGDSGVPSGWTVKNLITFTVDDVEYQAEEGMTFYDWAMSDYYDDSCGLSVISAMGYNLRNGIIEGNVSPGDAISIVNMVGISITPNINTDTIIQPISYMVNSGGYPD